ncbi:MAG: VOC family protein [Cyclobacteriaceae bacterium]
MNPVVHFELPYQEAGRAKTFYENVFGWNTNQLGPEMGDYILVTTATCDVRKGLPAGAIDGGMYPRQADTAYQYPSLIIGVEDIHEHRERITENGGKVLGEPHEIPGTGYYLSFLDPEGNRLSILEPTRQ